MENVAEMPDSENDVGSCTSSSNRRNLKVNNYSPNPATITVIGNGNRCPRLPGASSSELERTQDTSHILETAVSEAMEFFRARVLLVEDSDDEALLFWRAVLASGRDVDIHRATNILDARSFLAAFTPTLIILDCDLQSASCLDLLRDIRARKSFQSIPVVMLSSSESDTDIQPAYECGVNSFLRKPTGHDEYLECLQLLLEYWLDKNCVKFTPRWNSSCLWLG